MQTFLSPKQSNWQFCLEILNFCCSFSAVDQREKNGSKDQKKNQKKDEQVKRKPESVDSAQALEELDMTQTLKTMKTEDIWQGDGMDLDQDHIFQGEPKIMKDEKLWADDEMNTSGELESSSDCTDMVEEVEKGCKSTCKFCGVVFESKVELVEHVAMMCGSLKKVKNDGEVLTDVEDQEKLEKRQQKRGRKRKKFSTLSDEVVVKKALSYTCFNEECGAKFVSHGLYMAHLCQCVMTDDYTSHQKYIKSVGNALVYDNNKDTEGLDNEATGSVSADIMEPLKPFATLCPVDGVTLDDKKMYQCTQCSVTAIRSQMIRHITKVHLKTKSFCCNKCPSKYGYFGSFKDHYISQHTSLTYKCPQENCNEMFTKRDTLNRHILMDHKRQGKHLYLCKGCGKTFKLAHHARRHELYHRKEDRKHNCGFCGKLFTTKQDLERHFLTHTGIKPYKCSQCTYSAVRKFNLILHERKHGVIHGEHTCHICGKYFITIGNLKSHLKKHEDPPQVSAKSLPSGTVKVENDTLVGEEQPEVTDNTVGSGTEQVLPTESIPHSSGLTSDSLQGNQGLDSSLPVGNELTGSSVRASSELETLPNVQEALSHQTGNNLVYILTTGQPYDYTLVDTSMLNTT